MGPPWGVITFTQPHKPRGGRNDLQLPRARAMTDATVRQPLAEASANVEGAGMVSSSSVRFAEDTKNKSSLSKVAGFES